MASNAIGRFINSNRKITLVFSIISNVITIGISVAYVYVTFVSIGGLILTLFMAAGSLFIVAFIIYNTVLQKETTLPLQKDSKEQIIKANIFLIFAIPSILLNAASNFIGTYKSIALLFVALSASMFISPGVILGISITCAIVVTIGMLMYACTQAYEVWSRINPMHIANNVEDNIDSDKNVTQSNVTDQLKLNVSYSSHIFNSNFQINEKEDKSLQSNSAPKADSLTIV